MAEKSRKEQFGEELFELFARVLNSPSNREVLDSIRGEYGVLWYLLRANREVTVGELTEHLHVVPGRMTDILKSLEKKTMILRTRSKEDKRVVTVQLLETGREEVLRRRIHIHEKYRGMAELLDEREAAELLRLLGIILTYTEAAAPENRKACGEP